MKPEEIPEGYALIPIAQLTISEAATQAGRDYWLDTMPPIMQMFHISRDDYWQLQVAEHAALVRWCEQLGVIRGAADS